MRIKAKEIRVGDELSAPDGRLKVTDIFKSADHIRIVFDDETFETFAKAAHDDYLTLVRRGKEVE